MQADEIVERASVSSGSFQEVGKVHRLAVRVGNPGDTDLLHQSSAIGGEFDERCRADPFNISSTCSEQIESRVRARAADFKPELDTDQLGRSLEQSHRTEAGAARTSRGTSRAARIQRRVVRFAE